MPPDLHSDGHPHSNLTHNEHSFFCLVDGDHAIKSGGQVDFSTLQWWLSEEAAPARQYTALAGNVGTGTPLDFALMHFSDWLRWYSHATVIWSHGATFDVAILQRWYERFKFQWPFHYRDTRDTRTLWDLVSGCVLDVTDECARAGFIAHHPTWDAWKQARRVQLAMQWLHKGDQS